LTIAGSDGAVGKNKRIRMLMHASQGCLPIVYFAHAAVADGEAPAEGGLLGRYSDGPLIVPEVHLGDHEAPIITLLCGPVAPELEDLVFRSNLVIATPAGEGLRTADIQARDDAEAIAIARRFLSLTTSGNTELGGGGGGANTSQFDDHGASELPLQAVLDSILDAGKTITISEDSSGSFFVGLGAVAGLGVAFAAGEAILEEGQLRSFKRVASLASRFGLPLLLLQHGATYDVAALRRPAYRRLVSEIGALIHDTETAKISVITRRGQGGGDFILGGRELGTHYIVAWPDASVSLSEGAPYTHEFAEANSPEGPWEASGLALIDDVIAPSETRDRLSTMLQILAPSGSIPPIHEDRKGRVVHR